MILSKNQKLVGIETAQFYIRLAWAAIYDIYDHDDFRERLNMYEPDGDVDLDMERVSDLLCNDIPKYLDNLACNTEVIYENDKDGTL